MYSVKSKYPININEADIKIYWYLTKFHMLKKFLDTLFVTKIMTKLGHCVKCFQKLVDILSVLMKLVLCLFLFNMKTC